MYPNKPLLSHTETALLLCAFLLARIGMLALFYAITGGNEVASDVKYHQQIVADPLAILGGTATEIASYPPFQWIVEWPLYQLYATYFTDMVSYRLLMVSVELLSFLLLITLIQRFFKSKKMALTMIILFVISPHQYLASLLFVQEDVISQLVMLCAVMLLLADKRALSIIALVFGVLVAKIFFIIPLFYIIVFQGKLAFRKRFLHGVLALAPIIITYYISITNALNNGGAVPIRDFTPDADYAANYWVLILHAYPESLVAVKNASVLLSLLFQLFVITFFTRIYQRQNTPIDTTVLLTIPLLFFFATFYQHMPEYFLILWPAIALFCSTVFQQLILAMAFSFAWVPRVTHGLRTIQDKFGTTVEARSDIFGPLFEMIPINAALLNQLSLVAQTIFYTLLVIYVCKLSYKKTKFSSKQQQ